MAGSLPGALVLPRPLLPLRVPPNRAALPDLPSPPRHSLIHPSFALTTHLIPAAFPRTTPDVPDHTLPAFTSDKAAWKASVNKLADEVISVKQKQSSGQLPGHSEKPLWICLNRYVNRHLSSEHHGKALTLFFANANGLNKETWEPTLAHLISANNASHSPAHIAEIWTFEAANHGDSGLLNASNLGGVYDWQDTSRDMLHFLLSYLPSSPSPTPLPTHLTRLPHSAAETRSRSGFDDRTLVAVGHSFGGCAVILAAATHPALFASLVLVDPVLTTAYPGPPAHVYAATVGAIQRRHRWSSRDEARRLFAATPFFAAWDPAVLDVYVACGLVDDPDGGVTLKMPGIHEAQTFAESRTPYEVGGLLAQLDERVELRWVVPGRVQPGAYKLDPAFVHRRPANSSSVRVASAGHLIAQEAPRELGLDICEFLRARYASSESRGARL